MKSRSSNLRILPKKWWSIKPMKRAGNGVSDLYLKKVFL